jgi:uncharacterized BrkB/YihY/UPF0761 family membrane protein
LFGAKSTCFLFEYSRVVIWMVVTCLKHLFISSCGLLFDIFQRMDGHSQWNGKLWHWPYMNGVPSGKFNRLLWKKTWLTSKPVNQWTIYKYIKGPLSIAIAKGH